MNNTNTQNLKIIENPALYEDITLTSEEDADIISDIDTEALDKALDYLETQMDNPDAWVSWEDAKKC